MKRTQKLVTWGIVILVVLVVLLMLVSNLRRSSRVVLPDTNTSAEGGGDLPAEGGALTVVEVTPETVQAAIETLHRPEAYSRTVTVEYLWTGGSGTIELSTAVSAPWTRVDRTLPDGQVRHSITDGETTYIWYNGESEVYTGPAGAISADAEETIPTYEDVLALSAGAHRSGGLPGGVRCALHLRGNGGGRMGLRPAVLGQCGHGPAGGGGTSAKGRDRLPDGGAGGGPDGSSGGDLHPAGRHRPASQVNNGTHGYFASVGAFLKTVKQNQPCQMRHGWFYNLWKAKMLYRNKRGLC